MNLILQKNPNNTCLPKHTSCLLVPFYCPLILNHFTYFNNVSSLVLTSFSICFNFVFLFLFLCNVSKLCSHSLIWKALWVAFLQKCAEQINLPRPHPLKTATEHEERRPCFNTYSRMLDHCTVCVIILTKHIESIFINFALTFIP